jgi:hypothetical protein
MLANRPRRWLTTERAALRSAFFAGEVHKPQDPPPHDPYAAPLGCRAYSSCSASKCNCARRNTTLKSMP